MACPQKYKNLHSGIEGKVVWVEGNMMPTIDPNGKTSAHNSPNAIQREIIICKALKLEDLEGNMPLFSEIKTGEVLRVQTDKDGTFKVNLPEGKYSIFTKETKGYFANLMDGDGTIAPVEVQKDTFTNLTIEINYMASY